MKEIKPQRDTDILEGKLTHADRARITKAWNRAIKLGLPGLWRVEEQRDAKRGIKS